MTGAAVLTDVVRVALDADFTIISAAETKARLVAALEGATGLEIDVSHVAEMDTAGLQVLLLVGREARARDRVLSLVGESSALDAVLGLARIGRDLQVARPEVQS